MSKPSSPVRDAVLPFVLLGCICTAMLAVLWALDYGLRSPWTVWLSPHATEALLGFGEITVAVLGIAITVVAILVELAANRYTPRITELFLRDPINRATMFFFVSSAVTIVWIELSLGGPELPRAMLLTGAVLISVSLLSLLPYFAYVFEFLSPGRVISTIREQATRAVVRAASHEPERGRAELRLGVEQLGELVLNAVENKDKGIAIDALAALETVSVDHIARKRTLPPEWFDSEELSKHDQDFIALHPQMVAELGRRQTWVEMKVLRQYQATLPSTFHKLHDIAHLIGIHTRRIADKAISGGDSAALELCMRFFNTFLRASINAKDVRSTYNLLNEYRKLGESLLEAKREELLLELIERLQYYGQVSFDAQLRFLQETVAYDLSYLIELAHRQGAACHDAALAILLQLDREPESGEAQEAGLRGVRKAQTKLAAYYLSQRADDYARQIWQDMAAEKRHRLFHIREELLEVKQAEYWEVTDRGINFDYLEPEMRPHMLEFFSWFENTKTLQPGDPSSPAARAITRPRPPSA